MDGHCKHLGGRRDKNLTTLHTHTPHESRLFCSCIPHLYPAPHFFPHPTFATQHVRP